MKPSLITGLASCFGMGSYRLLLASMVVFGHMNYKIGGLNPGVISVISFFIISGYVTTRMIKKHYLRFKLVPLFYLDRILRIFPLFAFYLFLTSAVMVLLFGIHSPRCEAITVWNILKSLLIFPLGLYNFNIVNIAIVQPAWSLGLEAFYYLIIPFILLLRCRLMFTLASLIVFIFSIAGYLPTDLYCYRLLPGVLFMFLLGSYMAEPGVMGKVVVIGVYSIMLSLLVASIYLQKWPFKVNSASCPIYPFAVKGYSMEVIYGVVIGVPLVFLLSKQQFHHFDEICGNLSYGVFLNHFIFLYVCTYYGITNIDMEHAVIILLASFCLSAVTMWMIENPIIKYRKSVRTH